ncbi:MAG: hypothetical protein H6Q73_2543 [Firmicutes bacterium]|nr:hypothetical protein [Bacillota bacterium]
MKAVGIIAEYNPYHSGHNWHLKEARRLSGRNFSVAVMSGNFVQRGEPAIFDKWARAKMAVNSGVDLVLELPVVFAVRSAEYFAAGGIRLLNSLGIVSHVCFGAEHADINILSNLAAALNNTQVINNLRQHLALGYSYAAAWGLALEETLDIPREVVSSPNNILAIEYLRAITKYAPTLTPISIARRQAGYHDPLITGALASATAIRKAIHDMNNAAWTAVPPESARVIRAIMEQGQQPINLSHYEQIILAIIRQSPVNTLAVLPDISEGLENKLKTAALASGNIEELLTTLKVKRYSRTRLQRIIIQSLLGITKLTTQQFDITGPLYIRVLAFNNNGREMLRRISLTASLPIITKTTHYLNSNKRDYHPLSQLETMLAIDTAATDIYALGQANPAFKRGGTDFRRPALFLSDR